MGAQVKGYGWEILPGLPATGPLPEQFSATGQGTRREGFVVRFKGPENWHGNFQPGMTSCCEVVAHPTGESVIEVVWMKRGALVPEDGESTVDWVKKPVHDLSGCTGHVWCECRVMTDEGRLLEDDLNVRQLQAYAALCLKTYCDSLGIEHQEITALIEHLFAILVSDNLPEWEQIGAELAIPGRGDPLPEGVKRAVGSEYLNGFRELVENCVEVGIVDMYGASSERPLRFLKRCLATLAECGLEAPSSAVIAKCKRGAGAWGDPLSEPEFLDFMGHYERV